jgi:tRNA (guanine37-N1)-methyltransferase
MWKIQVLTLSPEIYPGPLAHSIFGRGLRYGKWSLEVKDIRDYASDKRKTVDSPPYGGGGGMLLRADVVGIAIEQFFLQNEYPIIYLTPKGRILHQSMSMSFVHSYKGLNILCGRFEGLDDRVIKEYKISEISIGDYVLSSGDVASFVLIDSCLRFVAGAIGNNKSLTQESFADGRYKNLLEYPHYTRPLSWKSRTVPEVFI